MYGFTLFTGLDLYLNGNKDNGWGFRFEGEIIQLFPPDAKVTQDAKDKYLDYPQEDINMFIFQAL